MPGAPTGTKTPGGRVEPWNLAWVAASSAVIFCGAMGMVIDPPGPLIVISVGKLASAHHVKAGEGLGRCGQLVCARPITSVSGEGPNVGSGGEDAWALLIRSAASR